MIHPDQVAGALQADTVLVSIMHVNNEIGVIQDISAISAVCAQHGVCAGSRDARRRASENSPSTSRSWVWI